MDSGIEANQAFLKGSSVATERPAEVEGRSAGRSAQFPARDPRRARIPSRKKKGSLGYQMQKVLQRIFHPGHRRFHDKRHHRTNVIRGIGTMRLTVETSYMFARYVRARWPEVHDLEQVVPAMAHSFMRDLAARGSSGTWISTGATTLRKLDAACRKAGVFPSDAPPLLPYGWDEGNPLAPKRQRRGAYTEDQARSIVEAVSAKSWQVGRVLELMRVAGLRISEAAYLRGSDVDPENLTISLQGSVNHTKGGRPRQIHLPAEHREFLADMRQQGLASPDGHLFSGRRTLSRRAQYRLSAACRRLGIECRGTHGLRKTYANCEYQRERLAGSARGEAMRIVSRQLGHSRVRIVRQYYLDPRMVEAERLGASEPPQARVTPGSPGNCLPEPKGPQGAPDEAGRPGPAGQ